MNAISIALLKSSQEFLIFLIRAFMLAQRFSIGFKSGEYGGRNKILHPAFSIISRVLTVLWIQ